jgi:hypothetical protein
LYGGERERQLRATLAAALGIAAALLPWPEARDDRGARIDLLAPRGRVDAVPSRVCWTSDADVAKVRLGVRDRSGSLLFSRTADAAVNPRVLPFLPEEQHRLASLPSATIELAALDESGELLGVAPPARIALPEPVVRPGAQAGSNGPNPPK